MTTIWTLQRARAKGRNAGRPLATVWKTLHQATVKFRRAQLHLIAAAPGVGKTVFALTLALKTEAKGIYFSADSDEATQYARAVSILTGRPIDPILKKVERSAKTGEPLTEFDKILEPAQSRLRWDFNPGPTLSQIEDAVMAYAHLRAEFPEIIIVDNIANVVDDSGAEGLQSTENILAFLHDLARRTKACVVALHHLTGEFEDGNKPAPLGGLKGKCSKLPEVVLNMYRQEEGFTERLGVAIVKNRAGKASAAGRYTASLALDLSRMSIADDQEESARG